MICPVCKERQTSTVEDYPYAASGLPDVTLLGIEVYRCASCGATGAVIPDVEQLQREIALAVAKKPARLSAREVRFLRKHLGWSGIELARRMGVTPESISRWENDREQPGPVADRLLRLMAITRMRESGYSLDALAELGDSPAALPLRLAIEGGAWHCQGRN